VHNEPQMNEKLSEYCSNENLVHHYDGEVVLRKITNNSDFFSFKFQLQISIEHGRCCATEEG
jgi:hypothetical protein